MTIFLDFDDVLFDTRKSVTGLKRVFARHGVSSELFDFLYKKYFSDVAFNGGETFHPYTFLEYLARDGKIPTSKQKECKTDLSKYFESFGDCVFSDTTSTLQFLTNVKKYRLVVVTYGNDEYQLIKARFSGVEALVESVRVTNGDKHLVICPMVEEAPDSAYFYLDDRSKYFAGVKARTSQVVTLLIKRPGSRYNETETKDCDYVATDLVDALSIIESHS